MRVPSEVNGTRMAARIASHFARLQQPQPSQRHGLSQPHTGAHWQPPLASALQAQALLWQLLQVHPLVEFLDMVWLFSEQHFAAHLC